MTSQVCTSGIVPVSVIVPSYNSSRYLEACIESLNLDSKPFEIVVVDDCSADDSAGLAERLAVTHSNVRVIRRSTNGGAAEARRDGFNAARCDWVAVLDADDTLEANAVSYAYQKTSDEEADICIWDMWRFDEHRSWPNIVLDPAGFPKTGRQAVLETLGEWRIHPLGVAKKKLYLEAYRNFNQTCVNADELITRLLFVGAKKVVFCEKKYFYRVNTASATHEVSPRRLTSLDSFIWLLEFCRSYPEVPPESIGKDALVQAWHFWVQRRSFGSTEVVRALSRFLPRFVRVSRLHRWLWRYPKHCVGLIVLCGIVRINVFARPSAS